MVKTWKEDKDKIGRVEWTGSFGYGRIEKRTFICNFSMGNPELNCSLSISRGGRAWIGRL